MLRIKLEQLSHADNRDQKLSDNYALHTPDNAQTYAGKDLRYEARENSTSGGVLIQYVGARRLSATKYMCPFQ